VYAILPSVAKSFHFPRVTLVGIVDADGTGECWFVVPGRPSEPFRFRNAPGPRHA
jgi:hypothetical protein